MKLYATITSERASKGQGGNDFIDVEIIDENRERILLVQIYENPIIYNGIKTYIIQKTPGKNLSNTGIYTPKGEQQKGENCPRCGKKLIPSETPGYKWQCLKCDEDFYSIEAK